MAKVKIEVLDAVVDGQPKGSQFEIEQADADFLESIGYVRKIAQRKTTPKKTAAKKAPAKESSDK